MPDVPDVPPIPRPSGAEGAAVGVVAVASHRLAAPHARFRLHEPVASGAGRAAELGRWAEHRQAQLAAFAERLGRAVGRPAEHIEADLAAGRWLSAEAAVTYGLVDGIWAPSPGGPASPLGFRPPGG